MPEFITNILAGIKQWVEEKLEDAIEELTYTERALYTNHETHGDIMAHGAVSKVGKMVHLYVNDAETYGGWTNMFYRLPYEPDSNYLRVVNDRGIYEAGGIHFKVTLTHQTINLGTENEPNNVTYPVVQLNHYVSGSIANWEYGQNISFKLDYITSE